MLQFSYLLYHQRDVSEPGGNAHGKKNERHPGCRMKNILIKVASDIKTDDNRERYLKADTAVIRQVFEIACCFPFHNPIVV